MVELLVQEQESDAEADRELAVAVRKTLMEYEPIRATRPPLDIRVRDGRVEISGRMRTLAMKEIAEYLVLRLPGVRAARLDVLTDPDLIRRVADALAADEALAPLCIQVDARYGVVTLAGPVPDAASMERAMQVAAAVPGVDEVVGRMRIKPVPPAQQAQAAQSAGQAEGKAAQA